MNRHFWIPVKTIAAAMILISIAACPASAQYPNRPIKVVVPFAAAGVTDIVARVVFDRVSRAVNQTIVIDNRPGAGGTIGIEQVVNAPPDGYTLIMADPSGSLPANVTLYPHLKYHPIRRPHAGRHFRQHRRRAPGEQRAAGEKRAGPGGAGKEQAGRTDLRLDRRRHAGPSQR